MTEEAKKRQEEAEKIGNTPILSQFKKLVIDLFDGSQEPRTQVYINDANDLLSCKLFLGTLRGVAMRWFSSLPPRSVTSFVDLAAAFEFQFAANKTKRLKVADLFDIKQSKTETLKQYLARFNTAMVQIDDPDQKFFVKAFQKGFWVGSFSDSLALSRSASMTEIRARVKKHVELIQDGYLGRFVRRMEDKKQITDDHSRRNTTGGGSMVEMSLIVRKRYSQLVLAVQERSTKRQDPQIMFSDEDYKVIADYKVETVLVDQGSLANILFWPAFQKMDFSKSNLEAWEQVEIRGVINLETTVGTSSKTKVEKIRFTVINAPTSYNVILGRPTLN
ncbi:hypothetical protein CR513_26526, partial [Mucuna pruriens]